jgi:hypothetical protein
VVGEGTTQPTITGSGKKRYRVKVPKQPKNPKPDLTGVKEKDRKSENAKYKMVREG